MGEEEDRLHLAALVDASDDAVIGSTMDGIITSWNEGARRIFGYEIDEALGASTSLLSPRIGQYEDEERRIRDAFARGERVRVDTARRRKDGQAVYVFITNSPIRDARGVLVGAYVIARDLTDRRRAEEALARAKDAAEAASRELEAFSYTVAHDLRAPLRGMNGFAQILLDSYRDKLDAEGQEGLEEIVLNAKKMGDLIDALLSLARMTRSELRYESVDLSALMRATLSRLRAAEPERAVDVIIQEGRCADLDRALARTLIENLFGNAWKFTSKTPNAQIEFGQLEAAERKDGALVFFVRDNGAGFDMDFMGKLFAPFQRLHTVNEFPGTGIGLATAQRIVRRHGGRIWAEGVVDRGATFYFSVPERIFGAI